MVVGLVGSLSASSKRDTTVNIYGVSAKTDANQDATAGAGIMLDSEVFKLKVEGTSDFIKSGLVLKFNPITEDWYFKVGANYIDQKMYAPDSSTARVNQYSGALATGYMVMDDLYVEIGGSAAKLNGSMVGVDYEVVDEKTNLAYLEVAKRWESFIGTIDTTANAGRVYHEFTQDENSYGAAVDYYPINNAKLGYKYQYEKENISNVYSAQYGLLFAEYVDNISTETYQVNAGIKIAFTDITDFSSYGIPQNIKPHLSELHRFEEVSFGVNMNVQSSAGVSKTQAAIDRDNTPPPANVAPTWTSSSYATGLNITDAADTAQTIKDLTAVSSDADGDTISYSVVSVSVPSSFDQTAWTNSVYIENGILKVHNLMTNNPNWSGTVTVTIIATATGGSNNTTVSFTFTDVQ